MVGDWNGMISKVPANPLTFYDSVIEIPTCHGVGVQLHLPWPALAPTTSEAHSSLQAHLPDPVASLSRTSVNTVRNKETTL